MSLILNDKEPTETDDVTYILTTTFLNPVAVLAVLAILFFIGVALFLGSSSNSDPYGSNYSSESGVSNTITMILGIIVGMLFLLISAASIAQYILKIDVVTTATKFFSPKMRLRRGQPRQLKYPKKCSISPAIIFHMMTQKRCAVHMIRG